MEMPDWSVLIQLRLATPLPDGDAKLARLTPSDPLFQFPDFGHYSYGHQGGNWSYNKMHGKLQ